MASACSWYAHGVRFHFFSVNCHTSFLFFDTPKIILKSTATYQEDPLHVIFLDNEHLVSLEFVPTNYVSPPGNSEEKANDRKGRMRKASVFCYFPIFNCSLWVIFQYELLR